MTAARFEITRVEARNFPVAWQLLEEYFEAVEVMVRDDRTVTEASLQQAGSALWVAHCQGEPAGCIALRPLVPSPKPHEPSGEIKRLWVRPAFRRIGIAEALLAELEAHAETLGVHALYLDTKDDLTAAIVFYQRLGYKACERYNNNPQATLFLNKTLTPRIEVREFRQGDEEAFWSLNEAWISQLFKLEPKDIETLREPQRYILSKGGRIYLACQKGVAVGCCALLPMSNGTFEVAKMGVAESARRQGVGRRLLEHLIADARQQGIRRLYLETNQILLNAIRLYESVGFRHLDPQTLPPSPYARANVFMDMPLV